MIEVTENLTLLEAYDLTLVVLGIGVLGLSTVLRRFKGRPISYPIVALVLGWAVFALPLGLTPPDPIEHGKLALHVTEIGVIISLMGVGLKIERLPDLRSWSPVWRMLGICMPLTMLAVGLLGWGLAGFAPAAAMLLASSLAPTDPVLAADVQVGEPEPEVDQDGNQIEDEDEDGPGGQPDDDDEGPTPEDELRFTLTAEAGLNDALAFPFTYAALLMAAEGVSPGNWFGQWIAVDVVYRLTVGTAVGWIVGRVLATVLLRLPVDSEEDRMRAGVGALAATLLLYGLTEVLGGYGFLAVFMGGLTIRHREQTQQAHQSLHRFAVQAEELLMTGTLVALGAAIAGGLLSALTWQAALLAILTVLVVRPVAGMVALIGERRLGPVDRSIASFFGIRGIGCLFYLAYGLQHGEFSDERLLWATCAFAVTISVVVHGVLASPLISHRDRQLERRRARSM